MNLKPIKLAHVCRVDVWTLAASNPAAYEVLRSKVIYDPDWRTHELSISTVATEAMKKA